MEREYINRNRYKRVARTERKKRTVARNKKKTIQKVPIANNRLPKDSVQRANRKRKIIIIKKIWKVVLCTLLILAIASISRLILKDESSPFIPNIFEKEIVNEKSLCVGLVENDLSGKYINNVIVQELDNYSYPMLVKIGTDYKVEYDLINGIDKISNKEYVLNVDENYGITASTIKKQLEEYMQEDNMYYNKFNNISKIEVEEKDTLSILLKADDEYFLYNLNVPVYLSNTSYNVNYILKSKTANKRVYVRRDTADKKLIQSITLVKVKSLDEAVASYKSKKIDLFFANSNRVLQLLGRYEYNIGNYRDGKMLFLLGNNNSKLYSKQEVRNAICYGIDRSNIIKNVFQYNVSIVDLPYIYDESKYKYDYIASDNILLSNKYIKKSGVYSKKENGEKINMSLNLLVNKEDEEKVKVADYIKKDLYKVGIAINIQKLTNKEIKERVNKKAYDLVLADISVNSNPNIKFISNNLCNSDSITEKHEQIKKTLSLNADEINSYRQNLSEEFSYMGIKANEIYVIYSKEFSNISKISYMNVFSSLCTINNNIVI